MMIYVVGLKDDFYYVGRFNITQLKNGIGPSWTKLHPPVSLLEQKYQYEDDDDDVENELVYKYMEKYGIDKVRGGSYNGSILSEYQIKCINNILKKNETTYKAKEYESIFVPDNDFTTVIYDSPKKAYSNTITSDTRVSSSTHVCSYCEMKCADELMLKKHQEKCVDKYFTKTKNDGKMCERCGRDTHTTKYCKAKTDIQGYSI